MLPQPGHVAEDRPEGALHNVSHLLLVQALRSTDKLPLDVSSFPTEFGGWGEWGESRKQKSEAGLPFRPTMALGWGKNTTGRKDYIVWKHAEPSNPIKSLR